MPVTSQIKALLVMPAERHSRLPDLLEACGTTVLAVGDCGQARHVLTTEPLVRVVFTDAALPDGDWRSVLEDVVRNCVGVRVVVCPRLADEGLWCDVLERGGFDLLVEPYRREDVQWVLEGAVRSQGMHAVA